MKRIKYQFSQGSSYELIQRIQHGLNPHNTTNENWSGAPPYPHKSWEEVWTDDESMSRLWL